MDVSEENGDLIRPDSAVIVEQLDRHPNVPEVACCNRLGIGQVRHAAREESIRALLYR